MSEQVLHQILDEIKGLNKRFGRMEEDFGSLKTDVGSLKTDVGSLKTDVGSLKTDVGSLHAGQAELYQIVTALKHGQELTHAKLEALSLDVRRLEGNFSRMENTDIRLLNHRIADVEMEVERLKNR